MYDSSGDVNRTRKTNSIQKTPAQMMENGVMRSIIFLNLLFIPLLYGRS